MRSPGDVGLPGFGEADAGLRKEAERAMKRLSADELDCSQLRDRATRRLLDLVARKREAGEDVVELAPESGEAPADEVDLMQVLKRSLAQADEDDCDQAGRGERGPRRTKEKRAAGVVPRFACPRAQRCSGLGGRSGSRPPS